MIQHHNMAAEPRCIQVTDSENSASQWPAKSNLDEINHPDDNLAMGLLFPLPLIPSMAEQGLNGATRKLSLYFASVGYLDQFFDQLGIFGIKIGVTGRRSVAQRIADLQRKRYAGIVGCAGEPAVSLPGDGCWSEIQVNPNMLQDVILPPWLSISDGHLVLEVPANVTLKTLDDAVKEALVHRNLIGYLRSGEGRVALAAAGYQPGARLFTNYTLMTRDLRISCANEIYCMAPCIDLKEIISPLANMLRRLHCA